ncbi:hypothetical protein ACUUL3_13670 [Thiovibrio sp. JS02]
MYALTSRRLSSFLLGLHLACAVAFTGNVGLSLAADDWKTEFNAICGQTQNALGFSVDELDSLIGRCDALKPRIEGLADSQASERKVFLQRLKMCREFYAFALSSKAAKDP